MSRHVIHDESVFPFHISSMSSSASDSVLPKTPPIRYIPVPIPHSVHSESSFSTSSVPQSPSTVPQSSVSSSQSSHSHDPASIALDSSVMPVLTPGQLQVILPFGNDNVASPTSSPPLALSPPVAAGGDLPPELRCIEDQAYNEHSMLTRAKNGIVKKKTF